MPGLVLGQAVLRLEHGERHIRACLQRHRRRQADDAATDDDHIVPLGIDHGRSPSRSSCEHML